MWNNLSVGGAHTRDRLGDFLAEKAAQGCCEATLEAYRGRLAAFLGEVGPRPTRRQAILWLAAWRQKGHPSPAYYRLVVVAIRAYMAFVGRDLGLALPRVPRKRLVALSAAEVALLLAQPRRDTWLGARDYALLCLLVDTGLRASEAVGLTRTGLDLEKRLAVVMGKGGAERGVWFGDRAGEALSAWLACLPAGAAMVFCCQHGKALTRRALWNIVNRHAQAAGLRVHPHMLRRTFATQWVRRGGSVFALQRLLGHSTLEMTR